MEIEPNDAATEYDLALIWCDYAIGYIKQDPERQSMEGLRECEQMLKDSRVLFEKLASATEKALPYSKSIAGQRAKALATQINHFGSAIEKQKRYLEEEKEKHKKAEQQVQQMVKSEELKRVHSFSILCHHFVERRTRPIGPRKARKARKMASIGSRAYCSTCQGR